MEKLKEKKERGTTLALKKKKKEEIYEKKGQTQGIDETRLN